MNLCSTWWNWRKIILLSIWGPSSKDKLPCWASKRTSCLISLKKGNLTIKKELGSRVSLSSNNLRKSLFERVHPGKPSLKNLKMFFKKTPPKTTTRNNTRKITEIKEQSLQIWLLPSRLNLEMKTITETSPNLSGRRILRFHLFLNKKRTDKVPVPTSPDQLWTNETLSPANTKMNLNLQEIRPNKRIEVVEKADSVTFPKAVKQIKAIVPTGLLKANSQTNLLKRR